MDIIILLDEFWTINGGIRITQILYNFEEINS